MKSLEKEFAHIIKVTKPYRFALSYKEGFFMGEKLRITMEWIRDKK